MKTILTITSDESLTDGLASALSLEDVTFERAPDWQEGRNRLVERRYQGVCLDYETLKLEGLNTFVQLDNILQKEDIGALLLLRGESPRATQFIDTLDSFRGSVDLAGASVGVFHEGIAELLDGQEATPQQPSRRPVEHQRALPDVTSGSLKDVSLARLVHALRVGEETGILKLSTGSMKRRFAFCEGALLARANTKVSSLDHLKAAFAWSAGTFQFAADASISGEPVDADVVLLKGAFNHLDQRTAMNGLMPVMQQYAALTTRWEQQKEKFARFEDLQIFIDACDGESTLESLLSTVASSALKGFQAGYVAAETDLVVLTDEPTDQPVSVVYIEAAEDDEGGTNASPNSEEPSTADREAELEEIHDRFQDGNAYEVFELWEGCGEDAVRSRFYKLVKKHHPDSYGGNISSEGKRMAEEIFITIKNAYSTLLKQEDEQTVPPEIGDVNHQEQSSEDGLAESLNSPSVTAMGSGRIGQEETAAKRSGDIPSEAIPDDQPGETSEASSSVSQPSADTRARNTSSAGESPIEEQSAIPMGGGEPNSSSTGGGAASTRDSRRRRSSTEETAPKDSSEDRAEKLKRLRGRASESFSGKLSRPSSGSQTSVDPDERKRKLKSLRESSSTATERKIQNLEPPENDGEAKQFFNEGYKAFKNEDQKKAFRYIEKAFEYDESHGLYKTFYAYLLFLLEPDKRDRSRRLLKEAIKSDNKQAKPDAHLFLGRILKVKERHDAAKKHFRRSLELNPNSIEAKRELRVYAMRGDKEAEAVAGGSDSDADKGDPNDSTASFIKNVLNKDLF